MKKIFTAMLSFLLLVLPFSGTVHAEENWELFVQTLLFHRHSFVFDAANRNRLTDNLDLQLPIEVVADATKHRKAYHDAVENVLRRGELVRYNCRVLAAWAYCKLHDLGVDCKEITIISNNPNGGVYQHAAVLIPSNSNGMRKWYICDISDMTQTGMGIFAAVELDRYISAHAGSYIGMVVNDDEYRSFDLIQRTPKLGGRDIAAWLATDADDRDTALEVLGSQGTNRIQFMSGEDVSNMDGDIIRNLILGSHSPVLMGRLMRFGIGEVRVKF